MAGNDVETAVWQWPEVAATAAIAIIIFAQPLSFGNLFIDLRPSLAMAIFMTALALCLGPRLLSELIRPANGVFALLVCWQLVSLEGHVQPGAYLAHWSSPPLVANAFSYIIIPQFVCFLLGAALGRDEHASLRSLDVMLWANFAAVCIGMLLYFTRPSFLLAAEARIFRETAERYLGFLPRMNGYFNSMIMGAVCYSGIGLLAGSQRRRPGSVVMGAVFAVGALATLQRGAWILSGTMLLVWGVLAFKRALLRSSVRRRPLVMLSVAVATSLAIVFAWQFAEKQEWFGIAAHEFQNRVRFFNTLIPERSGQWTVGLSLASAHPLGVGVGLLSHKAAEIDGLSLYAITDGNYFRILAETGIPGLFLFLVVAGGATIRAIMARRWGIAFPVLLLLAGGVGTNVFDLYYVGFVFWLLLGMASTATPLRHTIQARP